MSLAAAAARIKAPLWILVPDLPVKPLTALGKVAQRSVAILLFCDAWELLPRLGLVDGVFLPPFSEVTDAAWRLLLSGTLKENALASIYRSFSGFAPAFSTTLPPG